VAPAVGSSLDIPSSSFLIRTSIRCGRRAQVAHERRDSGEERRPRTVHKPEPAACPLQRLDGRGCGGM